MRRFQLCLAGILPVAIVMLATTIAAAQPTANRPATDHKRVCVYDVNSISHLSAFARMAGRRVVDCALVYNANTDWAAWVDPWFITDSEPDYNWASWVRSSPSDDRRQLVISQPLIPASADHPGWRAKGAAGDFTGYARRFARNLVRAGVGDAIIRLSWEANGAWSVDNIGDSRREMKQWAQFWRRTVMAMRSVPGAHFRFDWCVNNGYRDIQFGDYYPGNDVVNVVGDDVYDLGRGNGSDWSSIYGQPGGLRDVLAFAKAHGKPISLPEWGEGFASDGQGGDDAKYINHIARVIRTNDVAYQSYFYAHQWAKQLKDGPRARAAYHRAFGDNGLAVGTNDGTADLRVHTHWKGRRTGQGRHRCRPFARLCRN